jgi:hypothetical protein
MTVPGMMPIQTAVEAMTLKLSLLDRCVVPAMVVPQAKHAKTRLILVILLVIHAAGTGTTKNLVAFTTLSNSLPNNTAVLAMADLLIL